MKQMVREHKILDKFGNELTLENDVFKLNGKELTTVEDITDLIEGGTIDNAKPLYCHPISIDDDVSDNKVHIALLIFDNSNEEYNTYNKLLNKLNSIFSKNLYAVFPITGGIYYSSTASLHIAQKIGYNSGNSRIVMYTSRPDGTQGNFSVENYLQNATIYDGVNKVN